MNRRANQEESVSVGFDSSNLAFTVELLLRIEGNSDEDAASANFAADRADVRERLMSRAEQPFREGQDHIVFGQLYGPRTERFAVVYDEVPPSFASRLETRTGSAATIAAKFWICP